MIDTIKNLIHNNKRVFGMIVSVSILVFGLLLVIGALKNWDWLFKPDNSYHNKWTLGQISRYFGRGTARVIGFIGGLLLVIAGAVWSYMGLNRR